MSVWIRGLGRTAGAVVAVADREAEIRLAMDPRFGDESIEAGDAYVEHTAPRGLYRQPGRVRFGGSSRVSVSFTPSGRPELVQRREFVRLPVELTVTATLPGDETPRELLAIDLSASGLLLGRVRGEPLEEDTTLWLSIPLDDGLPPIAPRGNVVRGTDAGTLGVHFDFITDGDQERLVRYVMQEQLRRRREGKL